MSLKMKRMSPTATLPTRGSDKAAGLDFYADLRAGDTAVHSPVSGEESIGPCGVTILRPGERIVVRTGWAAAIPENYYGQVAPRSGLAVKNGVEVLAGVIDADYRGEIKVVLLNSSGRDLFIDHGMRIAQLLILPCKIDDPVEVDELDDTDRGSGGFGSTGT